MIQDLRFKNIVNKTGFTIFELIITLGILIVIGSFGLFIGFDFYSSYLLNDERDMAVSILQRARALSMNNINNQPYGVHFENGKYTIFEGQFFNQLNSSNQTFNTALGVSYSLSQPSIIFSKMSGDSNYSGNINITLGSKTLTIQLNSYGQINW